MWSPLVASCKLFLKNNPNVCICRSDKGNVTVAMNRDDYNKKASELLSDARTYRLLDKDPTISFENRNFKIIKNLKKLGCIGTDEEKKLITYKSQPPRFYGLPKIHKEDVPLRPIISSINAPNKNLSRFLANILSLSRSPITSPFVSKIPLPLQIL